MSGVPVIVGGAAKDAVPSVIIGGAEKKIYDAYVMIAGAAKLIYKSAVEWTYILSKRDPDNRILSYGPTISHSLDVNYGSTAGALAQASVSYTLSEPIHLPANSAITVRYHFPPSLWAHIRINGESDINSIWEFNSSGGAHDGTMDINLPAYTDLLSLYIQIESTIVNSDAYIDVTIHPIDMDSFLLNNTGASN